MENKSKNILTDEDLLIDTSTPVKQAVRPGYYYYYEPTHYEMLNKLFEKYSFKNHDEFVDFGCGLGRVLICALKNNCKDVIGIEVNPDEFQKLKNNVKQSGYEQETQLIFSPAEKYQITLKANKFYFYNPFHLKYFIKTINNIQESLKIKYRNNYIFLYDPVLEYITYLETCNNIVLLEVLKPHHEKNRPFYIYSITE